MIGSANFTKEHLDDPTMTSAECRHVAELAAKGVNRLIFGRSYKELGISRNAVLTATGFDIEKNRIHAATTTCRKRNPARIDTQSKSKEFFANKY